MPDFPGMVPHIRSRPTGTALSPSLCFPGGGVLTLHSWFTQLVETHGAACGPCYGVYIQAKELGHLRGCRLLLGVVEHVTAILGERASGSHRPPMAGPYGCQMPLRLLEPKSLRWKRAPGISRENSHHLEPGGLSPGALRGWGLVLHGLRPLTSGCSEFLFRTLRCAFR